MPRGTLFQHLTFWGLGNLGIAQPMQARVTPLQSVLLMCAVRMGQGCVHSSAIYEIVCRADPTVREGLSELERQGWMHARVVWESSIIWLLVCSWVSTYLCMTNDDLARGVCMSLLVVVSREAPLVLTRSCVAESSSACGIACRLRAIL